MNNVERKVENFITRFAEGVGALVLVLGSLLAGPFLAAVAIYGTLKLIIKFYG